MLTAMVLGVSVAIFSSLSNNIGHTADIISADIAQAANFAKNMPTAIVTDACDEETLCDRYGVAK